MPADPSFPIDVRARTHQARSIAAGTDAGRLTRPIRSQARAARHSLRHITLALTTRRTAVAVLAVLWCASLLAGMAAAPAAAVTVAVAPDEYNWDALEHLNRERAAAGLAALTLDPEVQAAAADRVLDMAWHGYFAHFGPDGQSAYSALAGRAVPYQIVGENLARTTYPAEQLVAAVHAALMNSPGHRANMLEPRFGRVGVAIAAVDGVHYIAYIFLD